MSGEWKQYDENIILYILGIGSPTYPIPLRCWYSFERDPVESGDYRYVGSGPLFTHQYSQAWLGLAGLRDGPPFQIDYFQNSVIATYAHRAYCLSLRSVYPSYSEHLWGITASDSEVGYVILGKSCLENLHRWERRAMCCWWIAHVRAGNLPACASQYS